MGDRPDVYEGVGTIEDAWITVGEATSSCHENPGASFVKEDIERVFYCKWTNHQEYADTDSIALFKLKNGKYVKATEWGDSSGHGCQCGGTVEVFEDMESLLKFGLGDDEREALSKYVTAPTS